MTRKRPAPGALRRPGPTGGQAGTLSHMIPGGSGRPGASGGPAQRVGLSSSPAPQACAADGYRRLSRGDLAGAEALFRQALSQDARHAPALAGLALVAVRSGHLARAADLFQKAASLDPTVPDHGLNAGSALWHLGRRAEACAVLAETARRAPRDPRARLAHGKARLETGEPEVAEAEARAALALGPNDTDALTLLGRALLRRGLADDALDPLNAANRAAPGDPARLNDLAQALGAVGRHDDAVATLRQATAAVGDGPGAIELGLNLAAALLAAQKADDADPLLRTLLERAPDHPGLLVTLGDVLQRQGRFADARDVYRSVLERDPGHVLALRGVVKSGRVAPDDPVLDGLRDAMRTETLDRGQRIEAGFALGKALEDVGGDPAAVFAALSEANALERAAHPDDIRTRTTLVEASLSVFTPALFRTRHGVGDPSDRPVFIVGMPRSGTSLVEQMLASHPQVAGGGELGTLPDLQRAMDARAGGGFAAGYPSCLLDLAPEALADAARRILASLDQAARQAGKPAAARVTDKLPDNAMRLGLIALVLPHARIIVCRRHPLDTGLSLFQQHFSGNIPYSTSLESIGRAMVLHHRIMSHWRTVLSVPMLTVDYETLVADVPGQGRRMTAFLELPWDDRMERFHETDRAVYTASKWQVRQPVFSGSVGRWERYATQLEPLRAILESAGLLDEPL